MIYIGIGSNLGNRLNNIQKAIVLLKRHFLNLRLSIILETKAILPNGAPIEWDKPYLNMVVRGESTLSPEQLLSVLNQVEQAVGRNPGYQKWEPRVVDLDILFWDNYTVTTPRLTIPHPELLNRPFLIHLIASLDPEARYLSGGEMPYGNKTFGEIAHSIPDINTCYSRSLVASPKLVGVVNITPDSFSDGGLNFSTEAAIAQAKQLSLEGATVIELGPQSTRPGAMIIEHAMEYARLQPVLEGLLEYIKSNGMSISLDTFLPDTILQVLKHYRISWVNDVTGNLDDNTLKKIAESGLKIVVMHALTIPPKKHQHLDFEQSPIKSICRWAEQKIKHLEQCGFIKENIILDPGIGFGKSTYQNLSILKEIQKMSNLGCEVLVGHSRKSYIASFYPSVAQDRDLETIALSGRVAAQGVDYLRVHNVRDHQRFFVAQQMVQGIQDDK